MSSERWIVAKVHSESHGMRGKVLSKMRNCEGEGAGGADLLSTQQSQAALKSRELEEILKLVFRILLSWSLNSYYLHSYHTQMWIPVEKGKEIQRERKDSSMYCHMLAEALQTSLFCRLQGEHLNRKRDTLDFYLMVKMLVFSYKHSSSTCAKPQTSHSVQAHHQSHSLRRFNRSNLRRFETLGQHLEPHRCACATKGFVFCHSLPSAPRLANSKAPEPFSTPMAKQPTGLGREQTQQHEKCLQLHISAARWKTN